MSFKKMTLRGLDAGTTTLVGSIVEAVRASGFLPFSGDSDFFAPLERLKLKGRRAHVIDARRAVARERFAIADAFSISAIFMSDEIRKKA